MILRVLRKHEVWFGSGTYDEATAAAIASILENKACEMSNSFCISLVAPC
jgi:hypothetical protein